MFETRLSPLTCAIGAALTAKPCDDQRPLKFCYFHFMLCCVVYSVLHEHTEREKEKRNTEREDMSKSHIYKQTFQQQKPAIKANQIHKPTLTVLVNINKDFTMKSFKEKDTQDQCENEILLTHSQM